MQVSGTFGYSCCSGLESGTETIGLQSGQMPVGSNQPDKYPEVPLSDSSPEEHQARIFRVEIAKV